MRSKTVKCAVIPSDSIRASRDRDGFVILERRQDGQQMGIRVVLNPERAREFGKALVQMAKEIESTRKHRKDKGKR